MVRTVYWLAALELGILAATPSGRATEPPPDKLVVLTFDDASKTHFSTVRPILKRYGFGATFFITEGFDFPTDKTNYLTWDEIAELHRDGFEIGNHTRDHLGIAADNLVRLTEQVRVVQAHMQGRGIPAATSFAYPGNAFHVGALPILEQLGFHWARRGGEPEFAYARGGGCPYEPGLDHPLLIPSVGDARPDWTLADFQRAVEPARFGHICVLQFHGVPDRPHPWVSTLPERFASYMDYLSREKFTVVALRDLKRFVPEGCVPRDPQFVISDRRRRRAPGLPLDDVRRPANDGELRSWLTNMWADHHYAPAEIALATGLSVDEVHSALDRLGIRDATRAGMAAGALRVLPYPGGRHPRTGFRDGAIRPQRETKVSVFTPWDADSYVVADVPEAIWCDTPQGPQLLFLAHTHVPTMWDRQGIALEPREWRVSDEGRLSVERLLPNGVRFSALVVPQPDAVRMQLTLHNGSDQKLSGLRVQMCIMLARAAGFEEQTNDNKRFAQPYALAHNAAGNRWIISAWDPCQRAWGNEACPCLHSDPQLPDCAPGETQHVRGWLSFYEGTDVDAELQRIEALGWRAQ